MNTDKKTMAKALGLNIIDTDKKILVEFQNCEGETIRRKVSESEKSLMSKVINLTIIK